MDEDEFDAARHLAERGAGSPATLPDGGISRQMENRQDDDLVLPDSKEDAVREGVRQGSTQWPRMRAYLNGFSRTSSRTSSIAAVNRSATLASSSTYQSSASRKSCRA